MKKAFVWSPVSLYIPIWFYSNQHPTTDFYDLGLFTFQSGSIQMDEALASAYVEKTFTFQSGSIQICFDPANASKLMTLHSNLVLFKWPWMVRKYRVSRLYIPIWFYSNPCSSIKTAFNVFFTFQSGSIQINKLDDYTIRYTLLYIPIWFYSNGYYRKLQRVYERSLHSNLVLFKSCINFLWPFSTRTLHSNLVLFKFHFLNTHIHYYVSLHSNLVLFK